MYKMKKSSLGEARRCMEYIRDNIKECNGNDLNVMAHEAKKAVEAARKKEQVKLDAMRGGKDEFSVRALDIEDKIDIMAEINIYIMDIILEIKKTMPKADLIVKRADQAARNIAVLQ